MSDDYPSVRKALFGDGAVANLYCAVKWFCWHLLHAIIVGAGSVFAIAFLVALVAYNVVLAIGRRVGRHLPTREVSASTAARASRVGGAAKSTPITRRIYNECPVNIKQNPRWYQRLVDVGTSVADRLEPPETVYLCEECGEDYFWRTAPNRCFTCGESAFEEVVETRADDRQAEIRGDDDPEVATDGGEDVVLAPGEDAAWCPDCEDWVPCECDGIPAGMEIRPYEPDENPEVATDGGRQCSTIVGDRHHRSETARPEDHTPATDGGIPDYSAGDRFEFTKMGFQFEIEEVREHAIELADGDVVDRDEFEADLEENHVELVDRGDT